MEAGGDAARLQGVSYALDDDTALQAEAGEAAFADARRKAEQYAALAGRGLGDVLWVREQVDPSGSVPVMEADTAGRDAAIPIAAGSTDVTVTVEVRWSLW